MSYYFLFPYTILLKHFITWLMTLLYLKESGSSDQIFKSTEALNMKICRQKEKKSLFSSSNINSMISLAMNYIKMQ